MEIGGAFRVPDILAASGAKMKEVGTTNRTRVADYAEAIGLKTGLILKVHTSNFTIVGYSEEAPIEELAGLARERGLPFVVDWGSGDLLDLGELGIRDEIPVGAILDRGADLVTFSCDKLLGGPQAGLAVGRDDLVKRMRRDPMARVLRLDRLQIAALRETLASYVTGRASVEVPTLRMLSLTAEEIGRRAEAVAGEAGPHRPRPKMEAGDRGLTSGRGLLAGGRDRDDADGDRRPVGRRGTLGDAAAGRRPAGRGAPSRRSVADRSAGRCCLSRTACSPAAWPPLAIGTSLDVEPEVDDVAVPHLVLLPFEAQRPAIAAGGPAPGRDQIVEGG